MSTTLSWFPMYHGDYLRDTGDLSPAEHGVYLLLLMHFVSRGPLADDLNRLCRVAAGADAQDVRHILERYWVRTGSGWVNGKMARVMEEQQQKHLTNKNRAKKAARARWDAPSMLQASVKQCSSNATQNQNQISPNGDKRGGRFTPPSVSDVAAYCRERGNRVDAEAFVDHYEANGWMRGKNRIKDWKACVRTWEKRDGKQTHQRTRSRTEEFFDACKQYAASDASEMGSEPVCEIPGEVRPQVVELVSRRTGESGDD